MPKPLPSPEQAIEKVLFESAQLSTKITQLTRIRSRVYAWLNVFVRDIYHERAFSRLAESIFDRYKARVDDLLATRCGGVLQKIPSISARLAEQDQEAISHALTTCRRIVDSFAETMLLPQDHPMVVNGETFQAGERDIKDRLRAYIGLHCQSKSRTDILRRSLKDLYDRVSTGVHREVTIAEAEALLLKTYMLLGEILDLAPPPPAPAPDELASRATGEGSSRPPLAQF